MNKVIVVNAQSSGFEGANFAKICINDVPVEVKPNTSGNYRGLHIVIINPETGKVDTAQVFDTYKSSQEFETFIYKGDSFITINVTPPEGHIVVAACSDDCVSNLSPICKRWLANMGNEEINNV